MQASAAAVLCKTEISSELDSVLHLVGDRRGCVGGGAESEHKEP